MKRKLTPNERSFVDLDLRTMMTEDGIRKLWALVLNHRLQHAHSKCCANTDDTYIPPETITLRAIDLITLLGTIDYYRHRLDESMLRPDMNGEFEEVPCPGEKKDGG